MKINVAISPCPNDTYIFEGIAEQKIDIEGFEFNFHYLDIAELNHAASHQKFDIIKISFAHYFNVINNYLMLSSGGALGFGVGPLLIAKNNLDKLENKTIAIPGLHTTANFLLRYYLPNANEKREMVFHEIEEAVLNQSVDAGVIIHENRFTYQEKGLQLIQDLGAYWENKTQTPIPLGGIVMNRKMDRDLILKVNTLIKESIRWQRKQVSLSKYIQHHAQEMNATVMQQHINLYVNEESLELSQKGYQAIEKMKEILLPENNLELICSNGH